MFMGTVVVYHQMQVQAMGKLSIKLAEKLDIFLMSMTRHTLADDGAVQHIEGGKQGCRAVSFVVMGHGAATTFFHGQPRLRSLQSLNLTLLIHAQDQGFIGRIQVQAHYIVKLFDELFISGKLEGPVSMWLQPIGVPDPLDRGRTDAMQLRHRSHTPMSRRFGSCMQSSLHYFLNLGCRDLLGPTAPRSIIDQGRRASFAEAVAPQNHRRSAGLQLKRDLPIRSSVGRRQNNLRAENNFLRTVTSTDPGLQNLPLLFGNCQCFTGIPHSDSQLTSPESYCKDISETLH